MALLDLLACPVTGSPLVREGDELVATGGGRRYPILDGVPVLLPDPDAEAIQHERQLLDYEGYYEGALEMLEHLSSDQLVLDIGAGRRRSDDPRIVRMDVVWTPTVDVIGDAHALPFRDEAFTCVFSAAVFEHLRNPFVAARQIWRVLRDGGGVFADCNFVFPYHGFPAVYFNASLDGMRQLFADFTEVEATVTPWQGPSHALATLVGEFLSLFDPATDEQREFVDALRALGRFPVHEWNERIPREAWGRIAAGVSYLGLKQPTGGETTVPPPALDAWRADAELRRRYPNPGTLLHSLEGGEIDTLWRWASSEGRERFSEIRNWFDAVEPFEKGAL